VVGYRGEETASPIIQAGLVLAPQGDREALATALIRVLTENRLWQELSEKSKEAHRQYFSWEVISGSFLKALEHEEG
jgi:glycosyltransferase involved in cell wall biosynthesis